MKESLAGAPDTILTVLRDALAGRTRHSLAEIVRDARAAAVLVPLVAREGGLHVVFIERSADLRNHSGQIAFPGGKSEESDPDPVATAMREADEELGIDPRSVRVLGALDDVVTPSGFRITPIVGELVPPPSTYRPDPVEVAAVFEVPLATLCDPSIFEARGTIERWGQTYAMCAYRPDGRDIWGATARMLNQLLSLL